MGPGGLGWGRGSHGSRGPEGGGGEAAMGPGASGMGEKPRVQGRPGDVSEAAADQGS